ncbi:MAG: hypothetical protein D3923_00185 [Candidatus Electrothrix sp. AR3]|nr:hypothetical protein [Candidatus Electrothrix sp. AR3]
MPLETYAEQQAEAARQVNGFKDFALNGVRDKIAEILSMIGRVDGIFSTYTLHDISHIDSMLNMLDWMIPPETKEQLTSIEWLLIVLSFYFHDLGMVVTTDEFKERNSDTAFRTFIDSIENEPSSRDYLDRVQNIPEQEKDAFMYQEYIRANHAHRIKEWVAGDVKSGKRLNSIAEEIDKIMESLPPRFRRNLADICESHHKDNLEERSYFPLCQRYGGSQDAIANIQYVALLLRTTDLLHITKDRTPSIMFRTLNISDLMGIDEWKKQMGTFSVGMKTRNFLPSDTDSHVIIISSDFEEERPFFVLTEYIAYADQQIAQNHRWASKSQDEPDAAHYSFPWHSVKPDIRVEGNEPRPMRFELDRGRLLDLLVGHTIYNDPTVAIRELLQNAIDAVRYQHFLDNRDAGSNSQPVPMGRVTVKWDSEKRQLIVQDQGTGMNWDVIRHHLMTVGASFYDSPTFKANSADFIPISRFGIGILTCFMVSDNVEIRTWKKKVGHRIRMSSVQANYLLKELRETDLIEDENDEHGTTISMILRPSVDLNKKTILDILRYWVIMPACEVVYEEKGGETEQIGFSSPADALRYFLFESEEELESEEERGEVLEKIDKTNIDIESRSFPKDGEEYELAFAVKRGLTPERNFVKYRVKTMPGTCLEGIRVDSFLPGLENCAAILAVKGNRAFRTTVSRDKLEHDEEYDRVADICASLFLEHIASEVTHIQEGQGKPLSQASTAARWLLRTFLSFTKKGLRHAESYRNFRDSLPQVISESLKNTDGSSAPTRRLIALNDLSELDEFWTIEARVVDYLGVISRDLGRELSYGEFLFSIAPDLVDPTMTPVISDAYHYKKQIQETHRCEKVLFSKRHQQTAVKWVRNEQRIKIPSINIKLETSLSGDNPVKEVYRATMHRPYFHHASDDQQNLFSPSVQVAPIEGDTQEVEAVSTRMGIVLSPKSKHADLWLDWISGVRQLHRSSTSSHVASSLWAISQLFEEIFRKGEYKGENSFLIGQGTLQTFWSQLLEELDSLSEFQALNIELPSKLTELQIPKERFFDVRNYWLNWDE